MSEQKQYYKIAAAFHHGMSDKVNRKPYNNIYKKDCKKAYKNGYYGS